MKKKTLTSYCDGVARFYRETPRATSFAAKKNASTPDDLEFVACMAYKQAAAREQDFAFADVKGFSLTLKIRVQAYSAIDAGMKALVDGKLYDVAYIDKGSREYFIYMEGGMPFGLDS